MWLDFDGSSNIVFIYSKKRKRPKQIFNSFYTTTKYYAQHIKKIHTQKNQWFKYILCKVRKLTKDAEISLI